MSDPGGARRARTGLAGRRASRVVYVIPLPRAWLLTSAIMVGTAVGLLAGVAATSLITARVRPDVTVGLVVGVPAIIGMLMTNIPPLKAISDLRPIQSASNPANKVEITLPSNTAATTIESWPALRPDVASRYGRAPAMMPTSTP